jgi:hypothetical protein
MLPLLSEFLLEQFADGTVAAGPWYIRRSYTAGTGGKTKSNPSG